MNINFVFFGTPQPAVEILEILHSKGLTPVLIVTNPDRPQGRNLWLAPPPVKQWAIAHGVPHLQPKRLDADFAHQLSEVNCQLFVVVAYGAILPQALLDISKHGVLNIHYSLLPKYRGASPVESQILADDSDVGVSILLLDDKMDHGPIIASQKLNIKHQTWRWPPKASELRHAMNMLAGELLAEMMPKWVVGEIKPTPQDHSKATYTKKFTKADGEIDLSGDPYQNFLKIQAFDDSIGTYFFVHSDSPLSKGALPSPACAEAASAGRSAGGMLQPPKAAPFIKGDKIRVVIKSAEYKSDKLFILRVVPEGKKEMGYEEFLRGLK